MPDYRSKNGIFSQLMKEYSGAKSPESLFSKTFFNENLRKKLEDYINVSPTDSHYLCKWLYDKGWLKRVYTQNIDGLYQKTGLPEDLVEFHGSIAKNNIVNLDKVYFQIKSSQSVSHIKSRQSVFHKKPRQSVFPD